MKLNNKGFAITAVLYGLLILFVVLVSSYLTVLSARKNRVDNLINEIKEDYYNQEYSINVKVTESNKNIISSAKINNDSNSIFIETNNHNVILERVDPGANRAFEERIECCDSYSNCSDVEYSYNEIIEEYRDIIVSLTINNITKNSTCYIIFS